jgi:peptidoglycan/LPS O-acetylase OafA/YrhL
MKIMDKCTGEVTGSSPADRAKPSKNQIHFLVFLVLLAEHSGLEARLRFFMSLRDKKSNRGTETVSFKSGRPRKTNVELWYYLLVMKTHFALLDAVRFFAAFWVMNFHYLFNQTGDLEWYRYGNLGVQLFFIISGFVIVQSLNGKSLKEFAINRFLRLFPLFWILCTSTYILTLIIPNTATVNFTEYLRSMTMFGDLFNGIVGYTRLIDPSYWTLTVELIFYICIGTFTHFFSYRNIRYFFGFWLVLSATAFLLRIDHNFYVKLLLVRHASYFAFGGALLLISTRQAKNILEKYFDWILLIVSAIFAIYIHPRSLEPYYIVNLLDIKIITLLHIIFFITIPILVYLSSYIKNVYLIRFFAVLGGITYPLYLLHQKIGNATINFVISNYDKVSWSHLSIGFEVVIICIAYLVYIEDKKLRTWLRIKLFKDSSNPKISSNIVH